MGEVDVVVRRYLPGDDKAIAEVHREAVHGLAAKHYPQELLDDWSPPVTEERVARIQALRAESPETLFVAESGGEAIGFSSLNPITHEITAVYVIPRAARSGVGATLLAAVEEHARSLGLSTLWLESSLNAEAFYADCGFVKEGDGQHRLSTGRMMPMVRMRKKL